MISTTFLVPLAALALAGPPTAGAPGGCRGKMTGAVKGEFTCTADVVATDGGAPVFTITPRQEIPDAPVYKPGAFLLPSAPAVRTYTLDDLGMGLASAAVEGGALYTASKTSSQRGEVTLTLASVKRDARRKGGWVVHGSYRARLVPASAGKTGDVVFEVSF